MTTRARTLHRRLDALDPDSQPPVVFLEVGPDQTVQEAFDQWKEDNPDDAAKLARWKADPKMWAKVPPPFVMLPDDHPEAGGADLKL